MSQTAHSLQTSATAPILGRYEMLIPIGSGGMATVWAARQRGSRGFQRTVAVKTILPEFVRDPNFDRMFLEEASLASKIHHPHVAEILDLAEHDGVLYLVMEWVDGETVGTLIKGAKAAGGIPRNIAARIIRQACAGLHAAHELRDEAGNPMGLVHLDVSPQNVLLTLDGIVKIVDFGIAKAAGRAADEASATHVRGKAPYMSPEQALGQEVDRRSDIFALGILLYWMTTGVHPFRGKTQEETLANIRDYASARPPSEIRPDYPSALERVVLTALARDREQRYATANELLHALDRALPEAAQTSTDDDIAFLHRVLGEKHEQRRAALKAALAAADEEALARCGPASRTDVIAVTPRTRFRSGFGLLHGSEVVAYARAKLSGCDGGALEAERLASDSGGCANRETTATTADVPNPTDRRRHLVFAAAAAAVAMVGLGALSLRSGRSPTPTSPLDPSSVVRSEAEARGRSTVALERTGAPLPSGDGTQTAQPEPADAPDDMPAGGEPSLSGVDSPEATAPAAPASGFRRRGSRTNANPPPGSAVRGQAQDKHSPSHGGDPFVSPVREPGF